MSCEASAFSKETPVFLKCNSPLFLIAIIFVKGQQRVVLVRLGSARAAPEPAFGALVSTASSGGLLGPRPRSAAVPAAAGGGRWRGGGAGARASGRVRSPAGPSHRRRPQRLRPGRPRSDLHSAPRKPLNVKQIFVFSLPPAPAATVAFSAGSVCLFNANGLIFVC